MSHPNAAVRKGIAIDQRARSLDRWLIDRVFHAIGPAPIRFMVGNGEGVAPPGVKPVATVHIRDYATLAGLMVDPEIAFGEGYSDGSIEVEGDLVRALEVVYESMAATHQYAWYLWLTSKALQLLQPNNVSGSRDNIERHYDIGNNFYKLWLDDEMLYTCAYFQTPEATLEEAQQAKMEYICRKLRLNRGETVVEVGCGWGALALYMARHYGVRVRAFNISREQIFYARARAAKEGLTSQVEFIEDDYRNISGHFDVFTSIGMLEHVGVNHYRELAGIIHRSIGDSGRGLLHFIGRSYKEDFSRWIRKRIFPGAYAPTLREVMDVLEPWHYVVQDVENLRPHYAKTLEHWLARYERSSEQVAQMCDRWFERAWRLYLAGSIAGFRIGALQLFQVVFAGPKYESSAWTREDFYKTAPN